MVGYVSLAIRLLDNIADTKANMQTIIPRNLKCPYRPGNSQWTEIQLLVIKRNNLPFFCGKNNASAFWKTTQEPRRYS